MRDSDKRLAHNRISNVVRAVRWRWRTRLILRGSLWALGLTGLVVFLSALALEQMRFSPQWVMGLRILTWVTLALSTYFFLIRPLLRRVTNNQVALYLEENEPSLEHSVVSALDQGKDASPDLAQRVVQVALERTKKVAYGRRVEQSKLYRFAGALTGIVLLALSSALLGPEHLRHGLSALLLPAVDAAEVNPYAISVMPGDVTIPRNSDQIVEAKLAGFDAPEASIFMRSTSEQSFRRLSMLPGLEGGYEVMLVAVAEETEYFIESTGVRSATFTIEVADLSLIHI